MAGENANDRSVGEVLQLKPVSRRDIDEFGDPEFKTHSRVGRVEGKPANGSLLHKDELLALAVTVARTCGTFGDGVEPEEPFWNKGQPRELRDTETPTLIRVREEFAYVRSVVAVVHVVGISSRWAHASLCRRDASATPRKPTFRTHVTSRAAPPLGLFAETRLGWQEAVRDLSTTRCVTD